MSTNTRNVVIRGRRTGVLFLVIATLFVLPPIVRATATIRSSSPIRLNRGFETPPTKGDDETTLQQAAEPASLLEPEPAVVVERAPAQDESSTLAPSDHTPDPQRGPPAFALR
jgi:hypothetical protein